MWWVVVFSIPLLVAGAAPGAKDISASPRQALTPISARSSASHPLVMADPLVLWCAADGLKKATFKQSRTTKSLPATSITGNNATLTIESPTVLHAGDWSCSLETNRGVKTETTSVYVRPVVHTDHPEKLETKGSDEFNLDMDDLVVTQGESVNISCPAHSFPLPTVQWKKDDKPLSLSKKLSVTGSLLKITDIDYDDEGVYTCVAINEYTVSSKTIRPMLNIHRTLKVKSQYSWIWPLIVIIVTFLLLILIIVLCELRKKRREKKMHAYIEDQ